MVSTIRLSREYQNLTKEPIDNVSFVVDQSNLLKWKFTILGPHDSPYEGGVYHGVIDFPATYPTNPPKVQFESKLFHPNVYPDGKLCISILHEGNDNTGYEHEIERWRPVHNVRTIVLSTISLLNDPNPESAANIDAAKMLRDDREGYYKKIRIDMES
jgi:ubiquitin-conjugating enzyme E2 G1